MALYTKESIERTREAVDMVGLVGARTDLRRVGSRWVGLCPFHDERTPSFSVDAEKKVYYCFGCGAKGDAIGFVREVEALEFREAVELLAERHGVRLELAQEDPREEERRRRRERLLSLLERTARFYATYLWEAAEAAPARTYLEQRGLGEEVLREFRVGYSPGAWDRLVQAAARDGFADAELTAAGIGQRGRSGGLIDRFRGRIMFPLADARGRVLGFGARALSDDQRPKYLNTSENELYHKGRQLFGIDLARSHAAKAGRIVVVEGYTDVLALHGAGLRECVAIMGTALTREQLSELGRAAPLVHLALDADRSGQEAMLRAARSAEEQGLELRVVELPPDRDPAELVSEEGGEGFRRRLEGGLSVLEFEVRRLLADAELDTPAGRDRALEEARPLIAAAPQRSATRDHLVKLVADRLDVPADYVEAQPARPAPAAVRPGRASAGGSREHAAAGGETAGAGALGAERTFLTLCAAAGELGRDYLAKLSDAHLSSAVLRAARDHLREHFDDPLAGLPEDEPAVAALVTGAATAAADEQPPDRPALEMSFLALELRRIERELRRTAREGDLARQDELAAERQEIRRRLDAVMGQTA